MFGHRPRLAHSHQGDHPHPLRRQVWITIAVAILLAVVALLLLPRNAHGNFLYWTSGSPNSSIGRAKINGVGLNTQFIGGLNTPNGVAIDSKFIYWTQGDASTGSIGRANLDGTAPNPGFIPHSAGVSDPSGIAVTATAIYWQNGINNIGRANIDGGAPNPGFITTPNTGDGLAADSSFLYFLNSGSHIGRATLDGGTVDAGFITIPEPFAGLAVDPSFLYWASDGGNTVGRVPVGGGVPEGSFIAAGTTSGGPSGVAVNSQYVFWGNYVTGAIGRANINGSSVNPALIQSAGITGPGDPSQLAAAPSNKITINSITKKRKKGTAIVDAKVPGPGQVTLSETPGAQDVNAVAAGVKQIGLTITQASSFTVAVKPTGKTKKKLKKQLRKKNKAKAKVTAYLTYVPAGVAGVPNTETIKVTLIKQRKKKK